MSAVGCFAKSGSVGIIVSVCVTIMLVPPVYPLLHTFVLRLRDGLLRPHL
jgi:hypothetical protein